MKKTIDYKFFLRILILLALIGTSITANAQDNVKNKVRLKLKSIKIMNGPINFEVKAVSRINKVYEDVPNIEINLTNEVGDSIINLGNATTNMFGVAKFSLKSFDALKADSSNTYNVTAEFSGNKAYKSASKSISFKSAIINAAITKKDSINSITATLIDGVTKEPIPDAILNVQVQRLFKNLKVGEDFYSTDENGTVIATIPKGIPGLNKNLTFEVILADSDDYGTVKAMVTAPLGTQIVQDKDFYEREMWSPRNKTPYFLLIFPNLLTLATWGLIIYLITNLFKITKS